MCTRVSDPITLTAKLVYLRYDYAEIHVRLMNTETGISTVIRFIALVKPSGQTMFLTSQHERSEA